jgi:cathepsin B
MHHFNTEYTTSYQQDKHFGTDQYSIAEDVQEIQTEILTKGPLEAQYIVYRDFYSYDSGVYQHVNGTYRRWHSLLACCQLVGAQWGNLDGLRGSNHCGIESNIIGDTPKV